MRDTELKTGYWWGVLLVVILVDVFGDMIGFDTAGVGDPITSNDLALALVAVMSIFIIEVRDAANYLYERLRSEDE